MDDFNIELCETFVSEGLDYVEELEPLLIGLSEAMNKGDNAGFRTLMNHVFRLIHTLKGSAGSLGFKNIAGHAHKAENLLDSIRQGRLTLTPQRLTLLTQSLDVFRTILGIIQQNKTDDGCEGLSAELVLKLEESNHDRAVETVELPQSKEVTPGFFVFEEDAAPAPVAALKVTAAMRSTFVQEAEDSLQKVELCLVGLQEANPDDRGRACAESLRILHSFKGNCGFMQLPDMESLTHAMETMVQEIERGAVTDDKGDELLKSLDALKLGLGRVARNEDAGIPQLSELLASLGQGGEKKASKETSKEGAPASPLQELKSSLEQAKTQASLTRSDVRVDLKKLDMLINLVGELVVAEAMVGGWVNSKGIEDEVLDRAIHHLKRTTLNLQDVAMSVRMVPVNQTFKKMIRLVHDTSAKLGKKVRLNLVGEDTEVDKTVIEQIADPLVHCVRNSIDHGLEMPTERLGSKKDETGTITLEARHEGGEVWVIIQDDGRGLNREKILARARERGLVAPEKESSLSDSEVFKFIFEPGFSTAEKVTDISGRGVGMDVVRKNIEKVKGRIRIESEAGKGSKVIFQIPLTLAIIDGMMIRIGKSKYTIPLLSIQESIRVRPKQITLGPDGVEMLDVRSNFIPIVRLEEAQPDGSDLPRDTLVVVVEVNGKSLAIVVDEILGQQQTVIKALPAMYKHSKNVSGCSILGNGDVSLILDVGGIAASLNNDEKSISNAA